MKSFAVRRQINAPIELVWTTMTDRDQLVLSGFGILKIEGNIGLHARIKLWSETDPKRAFVLRVVEFDVPSRMEWHGGLPFGLFRGRRQFVLKATPDGCSFEMKEDFSGPLSGLITKSMPDLQPSFDKFGDTLKRLSEEKV